MEKRVFVSYSTKDADIADIVEDSLKIQLSSQINITRYDRDVKYRESFKDFMKSIRDHDFVITIVSDSYLKSKNCLYEVGEILKDESYSDKLLFVVIHNDDSKYYRNKQNSEVGALIYERTMRASYIIYWQEEERKFEEQLKQIESEPAKNELIGELREIKRLLNEDIGVFIDHLSEVRGISLSEMIENNFAVIVKTISPDVLTEVDSEVAYLTNNEKALSYYKLVKKSDRDIKIALLRRAVLLEPNSALYLNSLGSQYSIIKEFDRAIECKNKAINIEPLNAQYLSSRGTTYHRWGDYEKANNRESQAIKFYNEALNNHLKAVELNPNLSNYQYHLCSAYYWLGDNEKAIAPMIKAIELDKTHMGYIHNLSVLYHILGKENEAIDTRRGILLTAPERMSHFDSIYPDWILQ